MAIYDYPAALFPQTIEWGTAKAGVQFRSPFNGRVESLEFPGEYWRISLTIAARKHVNSGLAEAFFSRVVGGVERVRLRHFLRPVPRGTMRGAPTLAVPIVRGDLSLQIVTTGTLLVGDMFKIGGQVFQAFADCSPVAGVLTVPLVQRVRSPLPSGAAVQWDRPTFLAIYPAMTFAAGYGPGVSAPISCDFEEVPE